MQKDRLYHLIQHTEDITKQDLEDLQTLRETYPWFSLPHVLQAKYFHDHQEPDAKTYLQRASAYVLNRKTFKFFLEGLPEFLIPPTQFLAPLQKRPSDELDQLNAQQVEEPSLLDEDTKLETLGAQQDVQDAVDDHAKIQETEDRSEEEKEAIADTLPNNGSSSQQEATVAEESQNEASFQEIDFQEPSEVERSQEVEKETTPEDTDSKEAPEREEAAKQHQSEEEPESTAHTPEEKGYSPQSPLPVEPPKREHYFVYEQPLYQGISIYKRPVKKKKASEKKKQSKLVKLTEYWEPPSLKGKTMSTGRGKDVQQEVVDYLINVKPSISRNTEVPKEEQQALDLSVGSSKMTSAPLSETYANLLANQGKIEEAIQVYTQLQLKKPEKKEYFAAKINNLKKGS